MDDTHAHIDSCDGSCQRCIDYAMGYAAGKAKLEFELRHWDASHGSGCNCTPCAIMRDATRHALDSRQLALMRLRSRTAQARDRADMEEVDEFPPSMDGPAPYGTDY